MDFGLLVVGNMQRVDMTVCEWWWWRWWLGVVVVVVVWFVFVVVVVDYPFVDSQQHPHHYDLDERHG